MTALFFFPATTSIISRSITSGSLWIPENKLTFVNTFVLLWEFGYSSGKCFFPLLFYAFIDLDIFQKTYLNIFIFVSSSYTFPINMTL